MTEKIFLMGIGLGYFLGGYLIGLFIGHRDRNRHNEVFDHSGTPADNSFSKFLAKPKNQKKNIPKAFTDEELWQREQEEKKP